jgi:hypothetical protein
MVPTPNLSLGAQGAAGTLRPRPPATPSPTRTRTCNPTPSPPLPLKGGLASVRDPLQPRKPFATRELTVGLDSYSDVTVAHRDIVYNVRPITERLSTGGGLTQYNEEGLVDIVDGHSSFRTLPALVASHPSHLPKHCMLLLGVPQLNELDIQVDTHRKTRGLQLASYDAEIDFAVTLTLLDDKEKLTDDGALKFRTRATIGGPDLVPILHHYHRRVGQP